MLIIPPIVSEALGVCRKIEGGPWIDKEAFTEAVYGSLAKSGLPFILVQLPDGIPSSAADVHSRKEYTNPKGVPLSMIDCILLSVAKRYPNVDVMTADAALAKAIGTECGDGRARSPRIRYYKRRRDAAWFVKVVSGIDVEWFERGTVLSFESASKRVIALDLFKREARLVSCDITDKPHAAEAIRTFFMVSNQEGWCPCSADGSQWFKCGCPDADYAEDGGLEKNEAFEYLDSLSVPEQDELHALVRTFRPQYRAN